VVSSNTEEPGGHQKICEFGAASNRGIGSGRAYTNPGARCSAHAGNYGKNCAGREGVERPARTFGWREPPQRHRKKMTKQVRRANCTGRAAGSLPPARVNIFTARARACREHSAARTFALRAVQPGAVSTLAVRAGRCSPRHDIRHDILIIKRAAETEIHPQTRVAAIARQPTPFARPAVRPSGRKCRRGIDQFARRCHAEHQHTARSRGSDRLESELPSSLPR
jgi:hypothetical protein